MNSDSTIHYSIYFEVSQYYFQQTWNCFSRIKIMVTLCHKGRDMLLQSWLQSVTKYVTIG